MRFKIDWASHMVGSKFTVFALFYLVFDGNFPSTSPQGAYYLEGRFNGGFFALQEGLIHGGMQNFTVILQKKFKKCEDFLTLHMYYFYHKNILKARVICCLTRNLQLTVIEINCKV